MWLKEPATGDGSSPLLETWTLIHKSPQKDCQLQMGQKSSAKNLDSDS